MPRIGFISDIHANIDALEACLERLDDAGVDVLLSPGDIVGYGGAPAECCNVLMDRGIGAVMGNHDAAVAGSSRFEYHYEEARSALTMHRTMLEEPALSWLRNLPMRLTYPEHDLQVTHANPRDPESFEYVFEEEHVVEYAESVTSAPLLSVIGHSHLTLAYRFRRDETGTHVEQLNGDRLELESGWSHIVTAGSVGQPRDGDPRSRCAIYDTSQSTFTYLRVDYDVCRAVERIYDVDGLPREFGKRLFLGV